MKHIVCILVGVAITCAVQVGILHARLNLQRDTLVTVMNTVMQQKLELEETRKLLLSLVVNVKQLEAQTNSWSTNLTWRTQ